ncbi:hypothetical protein [Pseudozobellia sp. WGM2]|uniref:hypothetical protein n=1 Tax=Pseudozobellia sp. WGM2 TaxID=2787625 RepID=UPI001ADEC242|nr:hypothetical protein [Pseudozobellia sp. WGM2]
MEETKRKDFLDNLFKEFIVPFTTKALSRSGIIQLAKVGEVTLLAAVEEELA